MKKDVQEWLEPTITVLGDADKLIMGGLNSDSKSTQQPDDSVFTGFSAGTV